METPEGLSKVEGDSISELALSFSEMVQSLFSAGSVIDTLVRVVELAASTIEGCDYAGLLLVDAGVVTTPVHTDPIVAEVNALQQQTNEGPCVDAIAHRVIFSADDLSSDLRWVRFAPRATRAGIRSVLALPLSTDTEGGALNLYARNPSAFDVVDRAKAAVLVTMASLALSVAHSHEEDERRAADLHTALSTRGTIGEALGILMERERISAQQAFDVLLRASRHLNIKLREVAQSLVDTGEDPDVGQPPPRDRREGRRDRRSGGTSS